MQVYVCVYVCVHIQLCIPLLMTKTNSMFHRNTKHVVSNISFQYYPNSYFKLLIAFYLFICLGFIIGGTNNLAAPRHLARNPAFLIEVIKNLFQNETHLVVRMSIYVLG